MDANNWVQLVVAILAGLSTAIPLIVKLVDTVTSATKEKNWNQLIKMTMDYMAQAEKNFASGADRKAWVLTMIQTSAATINYDLTEDDITKLSDLIDAICDASKVINSPEEAMNYVNSKPAKTIKKISKK